MVDDDDGDESPSPEPRTDSRSALLRDIRTWRRLRIVKRDESFSLIFLPEREHVELELRSMESQGTHETGGRAPYLVGLLDLHRPQLQLHIFVFGEKKSWRKIHRVLRYGAAAKP